MWWLLQTSGTHIQGFVTVPRFKSPSQVKNGSNPFKLEFPTHSNFDWSKNALPELQKFEIKYGFEYLEKRNYSVQRNFFRFGRDIELKFRGVLSYQVFMPKQSTHRMHDPESIVPHIRLKVFTDNQMSWIKYNYYINNISKECDDSQAKRNSRRL
jgi:hypothetical protein